MKAFQFKEWLTPAELVDVPVPEPGPDEVLIRIGGAGVCHSDLHVMHSWTPQTRPEVALWSLPFTLGHENAGWIESGDTEDVEAGMPVVSKEDKEAAELILKAGLKAEVWGFCRAVRGDIDACLDVGVKHIICEIATSPYKMKAYNYTPEWILEKVVENLQYAKSRGLYTAFFAVDATRADLRFLESIYRKAVEEGKITIERFIKFKN